MFAKIWFLVSPFKKEFRRFVMLATIYESVQVVTSYLISLVVRLFQSRASLGVWAGLLFGLVIFDELFMRLDNTMDNHIVSYQSYPLYRDLKSRAIKKFLALNLPWHRSHHSGALVGKVSNGVWKVIEIIDGLSWEFVPTLIQALVSFIPLLILTPWVALLAATAFSIFLWLSLKASRERQPLREKRHDLYETEWHSSIEAVQSVGTVRAYGQTERLLKEQSSIHDQIVDLGQREARIGIYKYNRSRIRTLTWTMRIILMIWIFQLYHGSLDIANLFFVSVLVEKLFNSFWRFARLIDRASEASEGANRLYRLMNEPEPSEDGVSPVIELPVGISFKQVNFSYEGEYSRKEGALHNFSLEIPGGSIVALIGRSGAGKSTISKVVTGEYPIQFGTIEIAGIDASTMAGATRRGLFSHVRQGDEVSILARTIRENIAFPRPDVRLDEVIVAAKLAGIHDEIMAMKGGYNTVLGERGIRLSGGQKQRVEIARAILADRPILILDEATSSVDSKTEEVIQKNLRRITQGKTVIIIAHRLSTVRNLADKIIVIDRGRKVEEGTHEELVRDGKLYAQLVKLQSGGGE